MVWISLGLTVSFPGFWVGCLIMSSLTTLSRRVSSSWLFWSSIVYLLPGGRSVDVLSYRRRPCGGGFPWYWGFHGSSLVWFSVWTEEPSVSQVASAVDAYDIRPSLTSAFQYHSSLVPTFSQQVLCYDVLTWLQLCCWICVGGLVMYHGSYL